MTPTPRSPARPLPRGLPSALAPLHRRAVAVVERLPVAPPSWALALALDRWLLPRLPSDARTALQGRTVLLQMIDFGLQVRLVLGPTGFRAADRQAEVALRISATAEGFIRLARGDEDPDRLFFERQLLMEGDTELGLVLKNTLDAIGPLWSAPRPAT